MTASEWLVWAYLAAMAGTLWCMVMSSVWAYRYHHFEGCIHKAYRHKQAWNVLGIVCAVASFFLGAAYEMSKLSR